MFSLGPYFHTMYSGGKVLEMELTNPSHKGKKKSSGVLMFNSALRFVKKGNIQLLLVKRCNFNHYEMLQFNYTNVCWSYFLRIAKIIQY